MVLRILASTSTRSPVTETHRNRVDVRLNRCIFGRSDQRAQRLGPRAAIGCRQARHWTAGAVRSQGAGLRPPQRPAARLAPPAGMIGGRISQRAAILTELTGRCGDTGHDNTPPTDSSRITEQKAMQFSYCRYETHRNRRRTGTPPPPGRRTRQAGRIARRRRPLPRLRPLLRLHLGEARNAKPRPSSPPSPTPAEPRASTTTSSASWRGCS